MLVKSRLEVGARKVWRGCGRSGDGLLGALGLNALLHLLGIEPGGLLSDSSRLLLGKVAESGWLLLLLRGESLLWWWRALGGGLGEAGPWCLGDG